MSAETATVTVHGASGVQVPVTILGQNLDMSTKTLGGLLSDRLENARFTGPADTTGVAPPWRPEKRFYGAFRSTLVSGAGLAGSEAQEIQSYASGVTQNSIVQTNRQIRAGETLIADVWARTRHEPVELSVFLAAGPTGGWGEYCHSTLSVDTTYWKCYSVRLTVPRDDDQAVFGFAVTGPGRVWVDQVHLRAEGEGLLATDVVDAMRRMRIPVLRFPGGCFATTHNWRDGIGPRDSRRSTFDEVYYLLRNNDFGTDEYLDMCCDQGITPHIVVNIGSATPGDAADWAAHIAQWYGDRCQPVPPAYFQIGNEDYGLWEYAHSTPAMYADTLRAYVPPIRAAYPGARIIANAPKGAEQLRDPGKVEWRAPVLAAAKELAIEVVAIHFYEHPRESSDPMEQQVAVSYALQRAADELAGLAAECAAAGVASSLGVTEWNYLVTATQKGGPTQLERVGPTFDERNDARHCLFIAGMIHLFARLAPRFELSNFYHLINACAVLTRWGIDLDRTVAADVFELYRDGLPGERLDVEVVSDCVVGGRPAVDCVGFRHPGGDSFHFTNLHPESSITIPRTGVFDGMTTMTVIFAPTPTDDPVVATGLLEHDRITLPPLSVARVK